jgi:hypothetical protein
MDTVIGKKWMCAPSDLNEEELLDPSEGGGQIYR